VPIFESIIMLVPELVLIYTADLV